MDARILAALELDAVATLYGLAGASTAQTGRQPEEPDSPSTGVQATALGAPTVRPNDDAIAAMDWQQLRETVRSCTACALHRGRKQTVFGVGAEEAPWLFIGEGPGAEEDERGDPFVGAAGKLLDAMLAAIGVARGRDAYIANVVKCRPPGNRTPSAEEAAACAPFLERQIALLRPKLLVALGKSAAARLLDTDASLGSLRGRVHDYRGTPLVVTYHPAYLLREPTEKAKAWEDLLFARRTLAAA